MSIEAPAPTIGHWIIQKMHQRSHLPFSHPLLYQRGHHGRYEQQHLYKIKSIYQLPLQAATNLFQIPEQMSPKVLSLLSRFVIPN
jgi:hypothetical protein